MPACRLGAYGIDRPAWRRYDRRVVILDQTISGGGEVAPDRERTAAPMAAPAKGSEGRIVLADSNADMRVLRT